MSTIYPTQLNTQSMGRLFVHTTSLLGARPIAGARITISYTGVPGGTIETAITNNIGQITPIELPAPPIDYSMEPSANQPYAQYDLTIRAPGYEPVQITGVQVLPDVEAIQNVTLFPVENAMGEGNTAEAYVIPPNTLFGDFPPKIAENEVKDVSETGEIVLSRVVIPEFVVVHDGPPRDTSAPNYYVRYRDYIKNVASSEIYATWPTSTIYANILAIQSFTLNRVYTEWYRNRGYNFTITASTAYDHKWVPNRNIFDTISQAVDDIFANYLSRPDVLQPILTQYCDGKQVTCPGWMTQWGSKYLGDQGRSAIEILRYFYGDDMYINTSEEISGVPSSWPGQDLTIGSRSDKVRQLQNQLNVIANGYPLIPRVSTDGIYGPQTAEAVQAFQGIFGLPETGVVDFPTWYRISEIYVAVSRIAELA
ncbi:MAG: peptidoglycan-binding protein [Acetivibrio ethanolgignens]